METEKHALPELDIRLNDTEWPYTYFDHERAIVRAIVTDGSGMFYFVRVHRNDEFGKATLIETSGGGVEPGETDEAAILRELKEELGADAEILCCLGTVRDAYNLLHRQNRNRYYLCRVRSFGQTRMTRDEIESFHLSTLALSYDEAVAEYEKCTDSPLGRLLARRELPVLRQAKAWLEQGYFC